MPGYYNPQKYFKNPVFSKKNCNCVSHIVISVVILYIQSKHKLIKAKFVIVEEWLVMAIPTLSSLCLLQLVIWLVIGAKSMCSTYITVIIMIKVSSANIFITEYRVIF